MKTYDKAESKRMVQEYSLRSSSKRIYGLAGPNADVYLDVLRKKGFTDITLLENNYEVFRDLEKKKLGCRLLYDDIRNHLGERAFYDYDFCCNITTAEPWLPEMMKAFEYSMTFSLRGIGLKKTIQIFRKYGKARYICYRDTSPMITFFK